MVIAGISEHKQNPNPACVCAYCVKVDHKVDCICLKCKVKEAKKNKDDKTDGKLSVKNICICSKCMTNDEYNLWKKEAKLSKGAVTATGEFVHVKDCTCDKCNKGTSTGSTKTTYVAPPKCHEGNIKVFEKDGVEVWAGGSSRGVDPSACDYLIDLNDKWGYDPWFETLAGFESQKFVTKGPQIISLKITDYQAPTKVGADFWKTFWSDLVKRGPCKVLVACMGGHGRTGLVLTCLLKASGLKLGMDKDKEPWNPILWIREKYCDNAVESNPQLDYLNKLYKIPVDTVEEKKPTYNNNKYEYGGKKEWDEKTKGWVEKGKGHKECKVCNKYDITTQYSDDIKKMECDDCYQIRAHKTTEETKGGDDKTTT